MADAEQPAAEPPHTYRRNYLVPALEVPGLIVAMQLVNRAEGKDWAQTHGLDAFWDHLAHGPWEYDTDPLKTNFVTHAYLGATYYNFARSSGLSFWWSLGYSFLGSLLWELGGETQAPSINDQILTPLGGSFVGEVLYRSFALILQADNGSPGFWRELAAFVVDPPAGFNRLLFGDRYRTPVFDEHRQLSLMALGGGGFTWTRRPASQGGNFEGGQAGAAFELVYGRPADPDFRARRPFDYFRVDASLQDVTDGARGELVARGLLGGWKAGAGPYRGVAGFFADYSNLSGGVFRLASASLGIGSTGELALSGSDVLRASLVVSGILIGEAGTSGTVEGAGGRHMGPGAQVALDLRLYVGDRSFVDLSSYHYYINGVSEFPGVDAQGYSRLRAYHRVFGPHSIGVEGSFARRSSSTPGSPSFSQNVFGLSLNYAWTLDPLLGRARDVARTPPR